MMQTEGTNSSVNTRSTEELPMLAEKMSIERTFRAPPERVWAMWTTKDGLEKWYWPEPFVAKVLRLDVRVGGRYEIAGDGLEQASKGTYTEVLPRKRLGGLAYIAIDPKVEPYDLPCSLELQAVSGGTKVILSSDVMHDPEWTNKSMQGLGSMLDKLAKVLGE